jgi:hypothetical protein
LETSTPSEFEQLVYGQPFFGDIDMLLRSSSSPASPFPCNTLSLLEAQDIMEKQGYAVMSYRAALELHLLTRRLLSQMTQDRDNLFGHGLWLENHLGELEEPHRRAIVNVKKAWEPGQLRCTAILLQLTKLLR